MKSKLNQNLLASVIIACSGSLLVACGGGSGGSGSSRTTASFAVTDAPVDDVFDVTVTFSKIELKPSDGDLDNIEIDLSDSPVTVEKLNEITGNEAETIVADVEIPAGDYQWVRLYVDGGYENGSYVVEDEGGGYVDLFIPGQQNGNGNGQPRSLLLNKGFTVAAGGNTDFTIDFVLRKALTKPANQDHYLLRPALRLVNNLEVGSISGEIASDVIETCNPDSVPSVYLYTGTQDLTTAGDYFDDTLEAGEPSAEPILEVRPLTSADVTENEGVYRYSIGFVESSEAPYSLAFTCDANLDDPEADDLVLFTEVKQTTVSAGENSEVDFNVVPVVEPPSTDAS